jgi:hypothetical protein
MAEARVNQRIRTLVAERAGYCCEYCKSQAAFATDPLSIEHVVPRAALGETTLANLALACQGCNNHRGVKVQGSDPVTGDTVALLNPRRIAYTGLKYCGAVYWGQDTRRG